MERGSTETPAEQDRRVSVANPTQRLLWQLDRSDSPRIVLTALEFAGVDAGALKQAVTLVLGRHPALRSRFQPAADGTGLSYRTDGDPPPVKLAARRRRDMAGPVRRTAAERFDLTRDAPARATVVAAGGGRAVLALCAHRIVLDEWSRQLLVTQIGEAYRALGQHRIPRLADPSHPADVEVEVDSSGRLAAALAGQRGAPVEVRLPGDRPWPNGRTGERGTHAASLGPELTERLRGVAERTGGTSLVTIAALLAATLAAETAQQDFLFGFEWLGRRQPERRHVVGMFTNTLLLRVDLTGEPGWPALLARVRSAWRTSVEHADTPFAAVAEALGMPAVPPVMVNVHGGPFQLPRLGPGASCREMPMPSTIVNGLTLDVTESRDDMAITIGYPVEAFDPATVHRMLVRLRRHAAELVNSLGGPLSARSAGDGLLAGLA